MLGTGDCDVLVRAYHAETGALLWQDQVDTARGQDLVLALDAQGGRVRVAGLRGGDPGCTLWFSGNCQVVVRSYDPATGALIGEDRVDPAASDGIGGPLVVRAGKIFLGRGHAADH